MKRSVIQDKAYELALYLCQAGAEDPGHEERVQDIKNKIVKVHNETLTQCTKGFVTIGKKSYRLIS